MNSGRYARVESGAGPAGPPAAGRVSNPVSARPAATIPTMDTAHQIEAAILSVAVTLDPVLVEQHVISPAVGILIGACCSALAAGLHLPVTVANITARRKP